MEKLNALTHYPKVMNVESFITAGLVDYSDVSDGRYLLKKEAIDKMLDTLEGRPVVMGHQKITEDNIDDVAVGYVLGGKFNAETGQFDCKIIVKDADIVEAIKSGNNKVSSAYEPTEFGGGGTYSGLDYDAEILNGVFTHLAIVDTPRYNDAKILTNNYEGKKMFKRLFKTEKLNEEVKECGICDEDLIEIDGETVSLSELKSAYRDKLNACNNECGEKKNEEEEEKKEEVEEKKEEKEEKENEVEEKEEEKEEEKKVEEKEDEKRNELTKLIRSIVTEEFTKGLEKSNSLRFKALTRFAEEKSEAENFQTRADRINESNKKYSK